MSLSSTQSARPTIAEAIAHTGNNWHAAIAAIDGLPGIEGIDDVIRDLYALCAEAAKIMWDDGKAHCDGSVTQGYDTEPLLIYHGCSRAAYDLLGTCPWPIAVSAAQGWLQAAMDALGPAIQRARNGDWAWAVWRRLSVIAAAAARVGVSLVVPPVIR